MKKVENLYESPKCTFWYFLLLSTFFPLNLISITKIGKNWIYRHKLRSSFHTVNFRFSRHKSNCVQARTQRLGSGWHFSVVDYNFQITRTRIRCFDYFPRISLISIMRYWIKVSITQESDGLVNAHLLRHIANLNLSYVVYFRWERWFLNMFAFILDLHFIFAW